MKIKIGYFGIATIAMFLLLIIGGANSVGKPPEHTEPMTWAQFWIITNFLIFFAVCAFIWGTSQNDDE